MIFIVVRGEYASGRPIDSSSVSYEISKINVIQHWVVYSIKQRRKVAI